MPQNNDLIVLQSTLKALKGASMFEAKNAAEDVMAAAFRVLINIDARLQKLEQAQ